MIRLPNLDGSRFPNLEGSLLPKREGARFPNRDGSRFPNLRDSDANITHPSVRPTFFMCLSGEVGERETSRPTLFGLYGLMAALRTNGMGMRMVEMPRHHHRHKAFMISATLEFR